MANEAMLNFLTDKITALQLITQELGRVFLSTSDLNQADAVRTQITSINQLLFALQSARNNIEATEDEVPPPSEDRVQRLQAALHRLDGFVSGDQSIQATLNLLTNVANAIRTS
jgi:hypothetical protein